MNDLTISTTDLDAWTFEAANGLPVPTNVNGTALLRALALQESSYGLNALPRHEAGWCPNENPPSPRLTVARQRHRLWGCLVCMSYGPLQILYHTAADLGVCGDPRALLSQRFAFDKAVSVLTKKLLRQHPQSLSGIADMWNSGSVGDANVPSAYITAIGRHYTQELARLG